jgi:hypothetical protein
MGGIPVGLCARVSPCADDPPAAASGASATSLAASASSPSLTGVVASRCPRLRLRCPRTSRRTLQLAPPRLAVERRRLLTSRSGRFGNGLDRDRRDHLVSALRDQCRDHHAQPRATIPPYRSSASLCSWLAFGAVRSSAARGFVGADFRREITDFGRLVHGNWAPTTSRISDGARPSGRPVEPTTQCRLRGVARLVGCRWRVRC